MDLRTKFWNEYPIRCYVGTSFGLVENKWCGKTPDFEMNEIYYWLIVRPYQLPLVSWDRAARPDVLNFSFRRILFVLRTAGNCKYLQSLQSITIERICTSTFVRNSCRALPHKWTVFFACTDWITKRLIAKRFSPPSCRGETIGTALFSLITEYRIGENWK